MKPISRRMTLGRPHRTLFCVAMLVGLAGLTILLVAQNTVRRDARLQDLEYARQHYVPASRAFSDAARKRALDLIHDLEQRAGGLSDAEFLIGMERLTALAQNGHDAIWHGDGAWMPEGRLPLRIIWFPDAMVIARAGPPVADLAGARIVSVEGLTPDALFARLGDLCGGQDNFKRWNVTWAIESRGILSVLGIAKSPDRIQFTLAMPDGRQVERVIEMVPNNDVPLLRPVRLWSGELSGEEASRGWRSAISSRAEPFYLRDADEPFRLTALPGTHAAYLQFRANIDVGNHSIRTFAQKTRNELAARHVRDLIVDMRFNGGGDISRTADLMREIPGYVTGRTYLLVSRYTFSAGIVATALLKQSGHDRVRIVGESVGDRLRWWSEGSDACLPNSHLCLHVNDGLWDLTKGCRTEPNCYGDRFAQPVGSLDPELAAPLTASAWLSGRDLGIEAVEAEIRKTAKNPRPHSP